MNKHIHPTRLPVRNARRNPERQPHWESLEPRRFLTASSVTLPDLFVNSLATLPYSPNVEAGRTYQLLIPVRNAGSAPSAATSLAIYFSTDATVDPSSATLLATAVVPAIAANDQSPTLSVSLTIPADLPNQTYYPLVLLDPDNLVSESDESNNITVGPTINVTAHSSDDQSPFTSNSADLAAGPDDSGSSLGGFSLSPGHVAHAIVTTQALDHLSQVNADLYLSSDSIAGNSDDRFLTSITVTRLLTSSTGRGDLNFTLPSDLSPGTYRLVAVFHGADGQLHPFLGDTVNLVMPPSGVDLSFATSEIHGTNGDAVAGQFFKVAVDLANRGDTDAGPFNLSFYLSNDNLLDASDTLIGARYFTDGMPAASVNDLLEVNTLLPANLPAGSYHLIAYVNPDQNADIDLSNNVLVAGSTVTVQPSALALTSSAPAYIPVNNVFHATTTLINHSAEAVKATYTIRTYLSDDRSYSDDDISLSRKTITASLKSHGHSTITLKPLLARSTTSGLHFLITITDDSAGSSFASLSPIHVTAPNLSANILSASLIPGTNTSKIIVRISNTGDAVTLSPVMLTLFDDDTAIFSTKRALHLQPGRSQKLTFRVRTRAVASDLTPGLS